MKTLLTLLLFLWASAASAQDRVVHVNVGANGVWYHGDRELPADFELGGTASLSLSPHISGVGGAFYGLNHSYVRGSFGARFTLTDVQDPNFSIGAGIQYHASSEPRIRPEEWCPDVAVGWKPYPLTMPRIVVGAAGWYGLSSDQAGAYAAVRYELGAFGKGNY